MSDLKNKKCIPCEAGGSPLTQKDATTLLYELNKGWSLQTAKITREFVFKDFAEALAFVNEVGKVAEVENHHPDINLHNWKKVTLTLSTHEVGGLSENDFILAAKIDALK